jgi:hypothetical protein
VAAVVKDRQLLTQNQKSCYIFNPIIFPMSKKPKKQQDHFDGNIACVINKEIEFGDLYTPGGISTFFSSKEIGRYLPIDPRPLVQTTRSDLSAQLTQLQNIFTETNPDECTPQTIAFVRQVFISVMDEEASKKTPQHQSDFYQIPEELLAHGRFRLSLLLDSNGGLNIVSETIEKLGDLILNKGGEIFSFGGFQVASAAANLFMLPKSFRNRFLLKHSSLLFHLGSPALEDDPHISENKEADEGVMLGLLHGLHVDINLMKERIIGRAPLSSSKKLNAMLESALTDPDNPDAAIDFDGDTAAKLGLATKVSDAKCLERAFNRVNGTEESAYKGTEIADFFFNADGT